MKKFALMIAAAGMAGYAGIAAADPAVMPPNDNNNAINCSGNPEGPAEGSAKNLGQTLKAVRADDPSFNFGQFKKDPEGEGAGQPGLFLGACVHNNPS